MTGNHGGIAPPTRIETADDVRAARHALGMTQSELTDALRLADRRLVRHWEKGTRPVSGPAAVAIELMLRALTADEDARDAAAYARGKRAIETGEDELVPLELIERIDAGEHPVRVWRTYRGMTQAQLAKATSMEQPNVARLERGMTQGSVLVYQRIAKALRVDVDELLRPAD